jgi:hypothetical protein
MSGFILGQGTHTAKIGSLELLGDNFDSWYRLFLKMGRGPSKCKENG